MTAVLLAIAATQRDSGMAQVLRLLVQVPTVREYIEIDDSPTVTAKEQRESRLALDKRLTETVKGIAKQPQDSIRNAVELINMEENGDLSNMQADHGRSSARLRIQRRVATLSDFKPVCHGCSARHAVASPFQALCLAGKNLVATGTSSSAAGGS